MRQEQVQKFKENMRKIFSERNVDYKTKDKIEKLMEQL